MQKATVVLLAQTINRYPTPRGLCFAKVEQRVNHDATDDVILRDRMEHTLRRAVYDFHSPREQFVRFEVL